MVVIQVEDSVQFLQHVAEVDTAKISYVDPRFRRGQGPKMSGTVTVYLINGKTLEHNGEIKSDMYLKKYGFLLVPEHEHVSYLSLN